MTYPAAASKDHVARGLARMLQQYKGKPFFAALLKSYLSRIQELENAAWEVILYRRLGDAEGIQLDYLGSIIGRGRNNLSDADYLVAIKGQIRINRSCGTPEDMIAVTTLSLPTGYIFAYGEAYPAVILISVFTAATDTLINVLFDSLKRTKPGGVRLLLDSTTAAPENAFTWSPDLTTIVDSNLGWGDSSDPSIGGYWATVLDSE